MTLKKLALLFVLLLPLAAHAQIGGIQVQENGTTIGASSRLNFVTGTVTCSAGVCNVTEAGSGTVTSVGLALPSFITVSNSPVTTTGTLTGALATQAANLIFAGPSSGGAVAPTFRSLVAADIPSLSATYLPLAGGTMSGAITFSGTQLGTYSLGGTPTLGATLALGGQTLSGNATFSGAITASGTASFDFSGGSGAFLTSTGAVTIGPGAIGLSGAVTSNIGGTTAVPFTITGVASQNGVAYTGTQPASVAGNGTAAGSILNFTGAAGGDTSGTTGQTAGTGEGIVWTLGAGGTAPGGSTNGTGGSVLVVVGDRGGGAGGAGGRGTATFRAPAATYGTVFQVQNSTPTATFTVADSGNIATAAGATYISGANTLIGAVADKLNAANLAIASQATGDLLQADSSSTFARLAAVAAGSYLRSGGIGAASVWSTATLPNTATTGDIIYASGTNVYANLADVAAGSYLRAGGIGVAPVWSTATLPNTATTGDLIYASGTSVYANLAVGAATTVLHGGTTPSYSAVSLTADVTGTLPVGNGGLGITTTPTNGQVPIGNGTTYIAAALTPGAGIGITNGVGTITVATAFSASWNASSDTGAAEPEDINFLGPFRTVTNGGTMRNINCSWGAAGTGGTTGVVAQVYNVTDSAQLCACTLGACTTASAAPLACDCNTAFVNAKTYVIRLTTATDCTANPSAIYCNVEITQ